MAFLEEVGVEAKIDEDRQHVADKVSMFSLEA